MDRKSGKKIFRGVAAVVVSLVLLGLSVYGGCSRQNSGSAADKLGRRLEKRLAILDRYIDEAISDGGDWMMLRKFPEDMVIYRYREDTLQSWAHRFPIANDDIGSLTVVQRLGDSRGNMVSPLSSVTEKYSFVNYGPRWYLVKGVPFGGNGKIVAGLEIVDELSDNSWSLQPLSSSEGTVVTVAGEPMFKLTSESAPAGGGGASWMLWAAVILLLGGSLWILRARPSPGLGAIVAAIDLAFLAAVYVYGMNLGSVSQIFSPLLYADGAFFYSLGAVFLTNLAIVVLVIDAFMLRRSIYRALLGRESVWKSVFAAVAIVVCIIALSVYTWLSFRSIVLNSDICLELGKVSLLDGYTVLVYLSFLLLTLAAPLLVQLLSLPLRRLSGSSLRLNVFSQAGRISYALVVGLFFTLASSILGLRKEKDRVEVWAGRIAMDRDISLEIQLRSVENQIATDKVISTLSAVEGGYSLIAGRLTGSYLSRLAQDYDISVVPLSSAPSVGSLLDERIRSGVRLSDNSHFFYSSSDNGRARYTGLFTYYVADVGGVSIIILVESKSNREDRGYLSMLGLSEPGRVSIPPQYSYARYVGGKLVMYKGQYGYPTESSGSFPADSYIHFVDNISADETVVISREKTDILGYIVTALIFVLLSYFIISILSFRSGRPSGERSYYKTRITVVMYVSLTLTLVAMAIFSVYFVYKRNDADTRTIMVSRINSLQSILQSRLRMARPGDDLRGQAVVSAVDEISNELKCDISLYSPKGLLLMSTTPEIFDRMILGHRVDEDAFSSIVYGHSRFFIHPERVGRRRYYAMYAPVMNSSGEMIAIANSPYTDQSYDFQAEAVTHIATIIAAFLLLLLISRFITAAVVDRMFRPLSEMSRKMKVSDVDHLEYIIYDRDDEITSLVRAYNLMVHDLSDSTRALAQAERDKAWSAMARQVAHEIKNPLTPIKLQLQMLIRMKESGNPAWTAKFDDVSRSVLEHIDILADTANEFSTFAKLYSEDPVPMDLDAMIKDEVAMFSSREDITFEYIGLDGAMITGPKPQLTRVIVNLVTNAVQAVEGQEDARVRVSLRNSVKDGFLDVVVEDNGPGVKEENRSRLFTPEFTTKTRGTGLGLAICRNIVDRCGGEIFYSRSFSLGGACFTVRYPKSFS